jgi:hypothetical protein
VARLPHPLASGALTPAHVPAGSVWHHIFLDRFSDPLGFGFASSRFSDPRRKPARRFGVYYVGETFEVAFLETIVRDLRNGNPGALVLSSNDLDDYVHVNITVQTRLDLVDLRGGNAVALRCADQCRTGEFAPAWSAGQPSRISARRPGRRLLVSVPAER